MLSSQNRDAAASEVLQELDKRFRKRLSIYFRRRLAGHPGDTEDLAQEVFVRLARRPDQNNGETIEGYVFKIAGSVLADWRRSRVARRSDAHDNLEQATEGVTFPSILIEDRNPERVLAGKEALQNLEKALAELNERTRNIFLLSRMDGVQHQDIARRLGVSLSTVEKDILKALAHIRRAFP